MGCIRPDPLRRAGRVARPIGGEPFDVIGELMQFVANVRCALGELAHARSSFLQEGAAASCKKVESFFAIFRTQNALVICSSYLL